MAEITACDVDIVGGNAPGCCEDECGGGGGGLDYCSGMDFSNMPSPSRPYCVPGMPECTGHPCIMPMCDPL